MLQNDQSEPIIPDPKASIQHVAIDPKGHHMAAVNNKVSKTVKICVFNTHVYLLRDIAMYGLFQVGNLKSQASCCPRTKFWHTRAGDQKVPGHPSTYDFSVHLALKTLCAGILSVANSAQTPHFWSPPQPTTQPSCGELLILHSSRLL